MSKSFKVLSSSSKEKRDFDWTICVLCQNQTHESTIVPGRGKRDDKGMGYSTLAKELSNARDANFNPLNIDFDRFDDGSGIEQTLRVHQACWHKLCRNEYSQLKLDRWIKRTTLSDVTDESSSVKTQKVSRSKTIPNVNDACLFCDGMDGDLHNASTFAIDNTVRQYAIKLNDTNLLRKIASGDLVAIEAKYHKSCMTKLFNDARAKDISSNETNITSLHAIALAELISYIDEACSLPDTAPVFRLADLAEMYYQRLVDMGMSPETQVNKTRLKERLLSNCPHLTATKHGREIVFVLDRDLGDAVIRACSKDADIMSLANAANILRSHIFRNDYTFNGKLDRGEQIKSVPDVLLAFVNMLIEGPNIKSQLDRTIHQRNAGLTIAQLIVFNCVKRPKLQSHIRHKKSNETPLPIYVGLKLHSETRKRELVDRLHNLGLSISYDRLLRMSSGIANRLCSQYEIDGVVCPPELQAGIFTVGQADNIDHNPSSVSAKDSFHGTAHSICQHPDRNNYGQNQLDALYSDESSQTKYVQQLPAKYTSIPAVQPLPKDAHVPIYFGPIRQPLDETRVHRDECKPEYTWLENITELCKKTELCENETASWAAFHASKQENVPSVKTNLSLLPFFREKSNSVAMISHIMNNNAAITQHLNPGQTPILTLDQPLYAIAKQIQWQQPAIYGEDKYVIMLGGLHTEMAALRTIGDILDNSGWVDALSQADIASPGTCEGFLRASHVTKTRRAHQVTAAALYQLQQKAYLSLTEIDNSAHTESVEFAEWCSQRSEIYPQFHFWQTILNFELDILQFVKSMRVSDFNLYISSQSNLIPWFFALDHSNYARWLPVHVRDMSTLYDRCADVFYEFQRGAFTAKKTVRPFSAISLDQAHEQLNALVKGDGGAVGLTEDPAALRRWVVAGPQIARQINDFEDGFDDDNSGIILKPHHEQTKAVQERFVKDVRSLVSTIEEMGNPFLEESMDLFNLNSKAVMSQGVVNDLKNIKALGKEKYELFIEERFQSNMKSIGSTIPRNNLGMFSKPGIEKHKTTGRLTALKNDRALFSRLYIASQTRGGDLKEFFRHENQCTPPSLSTGGQMRQGEKHQLLDCLEESSINEHITTCIVDCKVLDGPAVVHFLVPGTCVTFEDYAKEVFLPYILKELATVIRIDIVWDVYKSDSLKNLTREKRGCGIRRRVSSSTRIPGNWAGFLRNSENKQELFRFLAQKCVEHEIGENKIIYSTMDDQVMCTSGGTITTTLSPCSHEEADTRIFVHINDMAMNGYKKIMIRTVDTDVVVIAIAKFVEMGLEEMWIAFGTGKSYRQIKIHDIVNRIGEEKSVALTFFHAFTGCDTVSFFANCGKKSAWKAWQAYPEATNAFYALCSKPSDVSTIVIEALERFVVLMYDRSTELKGVDEARRYLFCKKSREIENIPPTATALLEHTKRAAFQAGYIWGQCLDPKPFVPSPCDWGWQKCDQHWEIMWTTLSEASKACYELLCCKCKKICKGNCKCHKANLQCTSLCTCDGQCYSN